MTKRENYSVCIEVRVRNLDDRRHELKQLVLVNTPERITRKEAEDVWRILLKHTGRAQEDVNEYFAMKKRDPKKEDE